jgi:hypothetical protein
MDSSLEIFNAQLIVILDYDPSPANAIKVASISMMTITDVESNTISPTIVYLFSFFLINDGRSFLYCY